MIRMQVQLSEAQAEALKALAATQNKSVTELIRESVDSLLRSTGEIDREERKRRARAAAGRFHSGRTDLSASHDLYLAEAYEQ